MNFKTFALATAAVVGISGAASAATMSVSGGDTLTFGTDNYSAITPGCVSTCYNPHGLAAGLTETLSVFTSAPSGLNISKDATIRVTFLGKEAGATNTAFSMGGGSVTNLDAVGSSFTAMVGGPGILDFTFSSNLGTSAGSGGFVGTAAIAFSAVFNGGQSVYAYFDDSGAADDRDWDDMVVRIDVIPVPAAGLLLLGGLGAMAAMKRRRKAA
jgi:hypothetical protein